jgi:hypothetical protein
MMSGQFLERNAFWFSQFNRWQHRKAQVDEDAPILPCVFEIDFALLLKGFPTLLLEAGGRWRYLAIDYVDPGIIVKQLLER